MSGNHPAFEAFSQYFATGDFEATTRLIKLHADIADYEGLRLHPLLREFASRFPSHVYRRNHLRIAERLTSVTVRAFRDAVIRNDVSAVTIQLSKDARLTSAEFLTERGLTQPLHVAPCRPSTDGLIKAGADLNALTSRGDTPLTRALRFGYVDSAATLLEAGADPNLGHGFHMPSDSMKTLIPLLLKYEWQLSNAPFLHDANHGHGARVVTWLSFGVDANTTDANGKTALHYFANQGVGRDAILALIAAGADVNAKDHDGKTALDLARASAKQVAARTLQESIDAQSP